jgi:hypothetical protein
MINRYWRDTEKQRKRKIAICVLLSLGSGFALIGWPHASFIIKMIINIPGLTGIILLLLYIFIPGKR